MGAIGNKKEAAKKQNNGTIRRNRFIEILAQIGKVFIAITFGVFFAGVYTAAMSAMIERISSLRNFLLLID